MVRVTELCLADLSLTGNIEYHRQFCPDFLICDLLGSIPIPKEIGQLTDLRICRLQSNDLSGSQDIFIDAQAF